MYVTGYSNRGIQPNTRRTHFSTQLPEVDTCVPKRRSVYREQGSRRGAAKDIEASRVRGADVVYKSEAKINVVRSRWNLDCSSTSGRDMRPGIPSGTLSLAHYSYPVAKKTSPLQVAIEVPVGTAVNAAAVVTDPTAPT